MSRGKQRGTPVLAGGVLVFDPPLAVPTGLGQRIILDRLVVPAGHPIDAPFPSGVAPEQLFDALVGSQTMVTVEPLPKENS